ncbi:uncharacterized protein CCOS01_07617 [Colletotrichum costaricense]|uniref:Uncharacterized protein n=1 Tax=Colletotrichum costaricense TaxID=1209916 RepID=A0AAJ0E163_9PEZI|nr:uncharacterized protein CCOS01_07617 [Colletotrichum costaricense]KAI3541075.1 hypothetical protein CSPX01_07733 [Colletotrichum filicis]KAK1527355.1 hypothetical protein CCOS01_07617 [Colletotrichum costaricense]
MKLRPSGQGFPTPGSIPGHGRRDPPALATFNSPGRPLRRQPRALLDEAKFDVGENKGLPGVSSALTGTVPRPGTRELRKPWDMELIDWPIPIIWRLLLLLCPHLFHLPQPVRLVSASSPRQKPIDPPLSQAATPVAQG